MTLKQLGKDGLWKVYFHGLTTIEGSAETYVTFDSGKEMVKFASVRILLNKI